MTKWPNDPQAQRTLKQMPMKTFPHYLAALSVALAVAFVTSAHAQDRPVKFLTDPPQRLDARFRLFRTSNMWTYLHLDTRLGLLKQLAFSVDEKGGRGALVINDKPLVEPDKARDGRFTLYPTDNLWTFILLDQDDGRAWQCQFSMNEGGRAIIPLLK
jgi:hypothetical protein